MFSICLSMKIEKWNGCSTTSCFRIAIRNEPESHGFIHFRIKTIPGLGVADVVENSVAIYFDFNEPVITNTATTIFYECTQNSRNHQALLMYVKAAM
jgi:hypothetical protein